jgi:pimeloyl-ACP methyl ester carboxylesterase
MNLLNSIAPCCLVLLAASARAQTPPELPAPQTITLFGQRIQYYDVGSGPAVVLLHGLGSSARGDWGKCIMPLAERHRVLALDQLGFGASDKPFIDYGIQTWVDFLGEFLREKKVEQFALAGESLGGWIAAKYTIEALGAAPPPGPSFALPRPVRLILSDAAGHRRPVDAAEGRGPAGISVAGTKDLLSKVFYGKAWRNDDAVRASLAWSMSKGDTWAIHSITTGSAGQTEAVDDALGSVSIPTLVVWGAEDQLVPLSDGRDYAAKIPGARLVVIPDCGHAPCIENPGAFLAAVRPFLDGPN